MIKKFYIKEITFSGAQSKGNANNNKNDVRKIQSWLNLHARLQPSAGMSTAIDGDFGPATEMSVKKFQQLSGLRQTGVVDEGVFKALCQPMISAFESALSGASLRDFIMSAANLHLSSKAFELTIQSQANSGPWVRSYMDGNEGNEWFWCMGFVQTIVDQAASALGKDFRKLMPLTYSCDIVASTGLQKQLLRKNAQVRANPAVVEPGDIFLVQKSPNDWFHTGIVTAVHNEVFETIEGNTNEDGSHNGVGVYKRTRNFMKSKIDVFSISPLV
jgi:peptidoglycan hydrolase-like protein with peptidoglycan-binding domain